MVIWPAAQLATNKRARADMAHMVHRDHEDAPSATCAPVRARRRAVQCCRSGVGIQTDERAISRSKKLAAVVRAERLTGCTKPTWPLCVQNA